MTPPARHGFTLVELLVATAVFVIGFAAVFTLFLSGVRFRKLADDTTLTATLASSLLTEVYLDSGTLHGVNVSDAAMPIDYDGDGRGDDVVLTGSQTWKDKPLFGYAGVPGTAYRIAGPPPSTAPGGTQNGQGSCCDVLGGQDQWTTTIVLDVIALCPGTPLGPPNTPVANAIGTLGDLERRVRLDTGAAGSHPWDSVTDHEDKAVAYENELVARGIAMRYRAAVVRKPHWMP
jgi:prepilin-type N-terminal cleavage/methylation domain-containing protein